MTYLNIIAIALVGLLIFWCGMRLARLHHRLIENGPKNEIENYLKDRIPIAMVILNAIGFASFVLSFVNEASPFGPEGLTFVFVLSYDVFLVRAILGPSMKVSGTTLKTLAEKFFKDLSATMHNFFKSEYITLTATGVTLIFTNGRSTLYIADIVLFGVAYRTAKIFLHLISGRLSPEIKLGPAGTFILLFMNVVIIIVIFAKIYSVIGLSAGTLIKDGNAISLQTNDFFDCLYFSVVTWTTVGYGDFTPIGLGRIYVEIEAFTGYVLMAVMVSALLALKDVARTNVKVEFQPFYYQKTVVKANLKSL